MRFRLRPSPLHRPRKARLAPPRGLRFKRRGHAGFREGALNYRHAFHAGNFADVFKHAVLLAWLRRLMTKPGPLEVLDTHAGAGVYDLSEASSARSGEAQAGIARVLTVADPPAALRPLIAAVRALNGGTDGPLYPGSPWLLREALRPGDRYVGCELREDEAARLGALAGSATEVRQVDGYAAARAAQPGVRRVVLIDPPFERGDEPAQIVSALRASLGRGEPVAVWAPIKDLDGLDRLVSAIEALDPPRSLAAQVRLHPLDAPLRLNGCAMLMVGGPDLAAEARAIAEAVVRSCGGLEARAVLEPFGAS